MTQNTEPSHRRIGLMGGTFDPPHYGHLILAQVAYAQLDLDRVLFIPAGQPPHKPERPITADEHRVAMVTAVIADNEAFDISRVDLDRPGPHYTVDTLALLRGANPNTTFTFLIGADSLAQMLTWYHPERIVEQARLAVMPRPGYEPDMDKLQSVIPDLTDRLDRLDTPTIGISSTDIRRRVREARPIRYMVPPAIEAYIVEHRLYTGDPK